MVARQAHNLKVDGSIPSPATKKHQKSPPKFGRTFFIQVNYSTTTTGLLPQTLLSIFPSSFARPSRAFLSLSPIFLLEVSFLTSALIAVCEAAISSGKKSHRDSTTPSLLLTMRTPSSPIWIRSWIARELRAPMLIPSTQICSIGIFFRPKIIS